MFGYKYSWGVDGFGRQHIHLPPSMKILFCVTQYGSLWECMDLLEEQENE